MEKIVGGLETTNQSASFYCSVATLKFTFDIGSRCGVFFYLIIFSLFVTQSIYLFIYQSIRHSIYQSIYWYLYKWISQSIIYRHWPWRQYRSCYSKSCTLLFPGVEGSLSVKCKQQSHYVLSHTKHEPLTFYADKPYVGRQRWNKNLKFCQSVFVVAAFNPEGLPANDS